MTTGALTPSVRIVVLATLLSTGFAGPVRADTITIGAHGLFGVIPFGGGGMLPYRGPYQQIYASTAFDGPFTIEGVAFKILFFDQFAGGTMSKGFTLSVGTTSASPAAPGHNLEANRRADLTAEFSGVVTVPRIERTDRFDFIVPFVTPFAYDPAAGNLLLDVFVNTPYEEQIRHFAVPFEGGQSAEVGNLIVLLGETFGEPGAGLLTQFSGTRGLAPVPEPSTLALLGTVAIGRIGRTWTGRKRNCRSRLGHDVNGA